MKLLLLTRFHGQHQSSAFLARLQAEAAALQHNLIMVSPADVLLSFTGPSFPASVNGQPFPDTTLILPLLRWNDTHGWQVAETLLSWGRPVLPVLRIPLGEPVTMARLLARRSIAAPRTWVLTQAAQLGIIQPELTFPCILRARSGGLGRRLHIAQHTGEAETFVKELLATGQSVVLQDLPLPVGEDLRVLVVNKQVLAAVRRQAPAGFVRPREAGNPQVSPTTLTAAETELALAAAKLHGAPFCTVNLLRRNEAAGQGPLLLEVGLAPVLTELEQATGQNLVAAILAHLIQLANNPGPTVVPFRPSALGAAVSQ